MLLTAWAYFNPRSPRGERPTAFSNSSISVYFNPRSPRGERPPRRTIFWIWFLFQPSLPARGATTWEQTYVGLCLISTLAPREGSDHCWRQRTDCQSYFNPRSPRGERLQRVMLLSSRSIFQPSLPARGATIYLSGLRTKNTNFNPRSPRGERQPDAVQYPRSD